MVPGQWLAADPKGRSVMIGACVHRSSQIHANADLHIFASRFTSAWTSLARSHALSIDKSKLVYILNRNAEGNLFPSSPLEAHKPHAIISAMIGVDVGYDNPLYACLETGYEEADGDWTGEAAQAAQKVSRGVVRGTGGGKQAFSSSLLQAERWLDAASARSPPLRRMADEKKERQGGNLRCGHSVVSRVRNADLKR